MELRRIQPLDIPEIQHWFHLRNLPIPPRWSFSDIGFIITNIAAGFLYTTNSKIAHIDLYISNPQSTKEERNKAIDMITDRIIQEALQKGIKLLLCNSQLLSIQNKAIDFQFTETGSHKSFARRL